jgi:hypothetical protein
MTALSLAGKGTVVAEKRSTRATVKILFPPWLNAVYLICHRSSVMGSACTFSKEGSKNICLQTFKPFKNIFMDHCLYSVIDGINVLYVFSFVIVIFSLKNLGRGQMSAHTTTRDHESCKAET